MRRANAEGSGGLKSKVRIWILRDFAVLAFGELISEEVRMRSSEREMSLCSRMAWRVALPSFPAELVRASILKGLGRIDGMNKTGVWGGIGVVQVSLYRDVLLINCVWGCIVVRRYVNNDPLNIE